MLRLRLRCASAARALKPFECKSGEPPLSTPPFTPSLLLRAVSPWTQPGLSWSWWTTLRPLHWEATSTPQPTRVRTRPPTPLPLRSHGLVARVRCCFPQEAYWAFLLIRHHSSGSSSACATSLSQRPPLLRCLPAGADWTERQGAGRAHWSAVASSQDGSVLLAGVDGGPLWASYNSGDSWVQPYQ